MSNITLSITTEKKTYNIGETIKCIATVSVKEHCTCNNLCLECYWSTSGEGSTARGREKDLVLFQGEWEPGEYTYKISLKINEGPLNYNGEIMNVLWNLDLRADIPWATDPVFNTTFILENNGTALEKNDYRRYYNPANDKEDFVDRLQKFMLLFIPPVCLILSFAALIAFEFISFVIAFSIAIVSAHIIYPPAMARFKLGDAALTTDKASYLPGETLCFNLKFTPRKNTLINNISIKFIGKEKTIFQTSGKHGNSSTRITEHIFYSEEHLLDDTFEALRGELYEYEKAFKIPDNAIKTLYLKNNYLLWEVVVETDISNAHNWGSSVALEVL